MLLSSATACCLHTTARMVCKSLCTSKALYPGAGARILGLCDLGTSVWVSQQCKQKHSPWFTYRQLAESSAVCT